eukprot:7028398-Prymnesium_polylepis.1
MSRRFCFQRQQPGAKELPERRRRESSSSSSSSSSSERCLSARSLRPSTACGLAEARSVAHAGPVASERLRGSL